MSVLARCASPPVRSRVGAFLRLGRPQFLAGGVVMFAIGAAVARATGHAIDAGRYALGQAMVLAFQLMTHYANDYFDLDADRANTTPTRWSGGSRVLCDDELPPGVALLAARVLAVIGAGFAIALAVLEPVAVARVAVPIASITFVLAWAYSAPPARLCAAGAGEVTTAIVVTGLVPLLGFGLQAPAFDGLGTLTAAVAPLACLQVAMLLAIELPDAAGDAATGKRTLVVRLGARTATRLGVGLMVAAGVLLVAMHPLGLLYVPFAAWQIARVLHGYDDPARWGGLASGAIALLVGTSLGVLAGFLLA